MPNAFKLALASALLVSGIAHAGKTTVCTVTVNSPDEREAFKAALPGDQYEFVELVEQGRPDWLTTSCRRKIQCDVLIVSGHFAGTEFYSSKPQVNETLPVDEMERVACSDTCPDLFSHLKEVYLFGCDTLKREPVRSATPEIIRGLVRSGQPRAEAERIARALSERNAENARDRMRRIFPDVPVIYGFSSLAPYGRTAGPMLQGYLRSDAAEPVGTGRVSSRLLALFAPSSMVVTHGLRETDLNADYRAQACRYYDDRLTRGDKLRAIHEVMAGDAAQVRMNFDRVEKFFAATNDRERYEGSFAVRLAEMAGDHAVRDRYVALARDTEDPAIRIRMISLARTIGWLSAKERQAELTFMIRDVLAGDNVGFGEVDLICGLNKERELDAALQKVANVKPRPAHAAALACLGSPEARRRVLRALASPDEAEVQVAQAYLRHRPITDAAELRSATLGVTRMQNSGAQVRALEVVARHHVEDRETLDALAQLFAQTRSPAVQRAIAEIFIRSDLRAVAVPKLAELVRQHRLKPHGDGQDLVDVLLIRLQRG
jgi:hypothetical protein